ncbi:unnamed protein product [Mytilus edulis]|uniref:Uncharacterized protein n=1 Tax=Mytilus edulis TaxID=6550 RepID=A0A8S3UAV4_MYTED|nr:unnamed protein product [Mytilus edulis]
MDIKQSAKAKKISDKIHCDFNYRFRNGECRQDEESSSRSPSIAVAFCEEYCIKVYDSENFKIKQKLSCGYYFCGVSVESDWLVSAIRDDGIYFIKCSDGNILKVLPSYIEHLSYVHIKRGNTFVSDETNHSVHCLNRDKETVWTFSSHAMKGPKDICTDAFGNIFVAACDSQSLIAISSDGKICKKLL